MLQLTRTLVRQRGLLRVLTERELKARYRGSALGFLWSLLNPLLLLAVYSFVFGVIMASRFDGAPKPYWLFLITGLFPWIWVSSSLLEGTVSLSVNAGLLRKSVFPVEVLPVVTVLSQLAHFLLALPILIGALLVGRLQGTPALGMAALFLPLVIVLQLVLLIGLVLGLAALNAHFKDTRDLLANLLTVAFFLAPILYTLEMFEESPVRHAILLNPMTHFTHAYQNILFFDAVPSAVEWSILVALALVGLAIGSWVFGRLSDTLAEAL